MNRIYLSVLSALVLSAIQPSRASRQYEVSVTQAGPRISLRAVDAPVEQIARRIGAATGVEIRLDPQLRERRLTLNLASRAADHLLWALARRLDARAEIVYVFRARSAAASNSTAAWAYATESVNVSAPLSDRPM